MASTARQFYQRIGNAPRVVTGKSAVDKLKQKKLIAFREHQRKIIERFTPLGSTQSRETSWQPHHPLHKPPSPTTITLSALIASGAHLGHAREHTRPSFLPYVYGHRAGLTLIDLDASLPLLRRAANVTRAVAANGGAILFVGRDIPIVRKAAERMGRNGYYVGKKWLHGLFTNAREVLGDHVVETTNVKPDLVIFLNPRQNLDAIRECAIARIPTIGVVDSNVDPRVVMYPIPLNDESVQTAELVAGVLSIAGRDGVKRFDEREGLEGGDKRVEAARKEIENLDLGA